MWSVCYLNGYLVYIQSISYNINIKLILKMKFRWNKYEMLWKRQSQSKTIQNSIKTISKSTSNVCYIHINSCNINCKGISSHNCIKTWITLDVRTINKIFWIPIYICLKSILTYIYVIKHDIQWIIAWNNINKH